MINAAEKEGGNSIFVTSTVKGEGKTFVSFNLALTLANSDKKVLLVGADFRNPQLQRYFPNARQKLGVSAYLVSNTLVLKDLVAKSDIHLVDLSIQVGAEYHSLNDLFIESGSI